MIPAFIILGLLYASYKLSKPKKKQDPLALLRKTYRARKLKEFENN